jgi:hypothetical protein
MLANQIKAGFGAFENEGAFLCPGGAEVGSGRLGHATEFEERMPRPP